MEEDSGYNKVEMVIGCHIEDAITFWAQNTNRQADIVKISRALIEICPNASPVFGLPDLTKCRVLYIDYGNSEILNRSEIVEIPADLQFPSVAKKYKLWGLQIPPDQDFNQFDQGMKFLNSLVYEKEIKARYKTTFQDGTVVVQAESSLLDIGEEIVKKGFAERCNSPIKNNNCGMQLDPSLYQSRTSKPTTASWLSRNSPSASNRVREGLDDQMLMNVKSEATNRVSFINREKVLTSDFRRVSNISLEKIKHDQKTIEEKEKLKEENEAFRGENQNLLNRCEELELKVKKLTCDMEKEKQASKRKLEYFERLLPTYIGTTVEGLAAKFEKLKEARYRVHTSKSARFGEDLSEAVKVITSGCLVAPCSLEKLERTWAEYYSAQEEIRSCRSVAEVQSLILQRNEVQKQFYSAVEKFIIEVEDLPLSERLETLQKLQRSLEATYGHVGQVYQAENSEEVFETFFEWKNAKQEEFNHARNATDASLQNLVKCFRGIIKFFDMTLEPHLKFEDVIDNVDKVLKKAELDISQELNICLIELDEADKKIMLKVHNEVMVKIHQEQHLLDTVFLKYLDSVEFKKQIVEWLDTSPNVDNLLMIKKRLKNMKAQLRWKLVEKRNLEESDDYSESEMQKIKEEITRLRNAIFQEIYQEQEEYEKITHLVQKWFPELPLLHPEAGILKYINSEGLLSVSLDRDLLEAEPMKELSTKHPLLCSKVQGQEVLLKSDPVAYLMVPYYAGASLGALQTNAPLTQEETMKVMKGVARGLCTLHGAEIVHGSLHENNVFAVNRERGIVGDFDFTKSEGQRASVNSVALNGLLSLTAPEVKKGQPLSAASDMYAYGCLLYWLLIGSQKFKVDEDGVPQIDGLNMDDKVKSLLLNLLCWNNRLTAKQVLNDDCFLLPEVIPIPSENEPTECENEEERRDKEIVSEDKLDSEMELSLENMDHDSC
ncbi:hypothetical protein lerEdw1_020307 [Lerista edwardsae]|nr:hypothetical protein lerEdw1_020307 [Lerista edwardsae]